MVPVYWDHWDQAGTFKRMPYRVKSGMGAVIDGNGCWSIPWWCGDSAFSTGLFSSCALPTPAQMTAAAQSPTCNLGPAASAATVAMNAQLNSTTVQDQCTADPTNCSAYNLAVSSPFISNIFGDNWLGQTLNAATGGNADGTPTVPGAVPAWVYLAGAIAVGIFVLEAMR